MTIRVIGRIYDPETKAWTKQVMTEHRTVEDAFAWCDFNKSYGKDLNVYKDGKRQWRTCN